MAKAEIIFPDGTKMVLDGSVEEVMRIKKHFSQKEKSVDNLASEKKNSPGPLGRIGLLIEENFFNDKRTLKDIRKKLEEKAIFYSPQMISPALIRSIKKGRLRRIKEAGKWRYVNP